MNEFEHKKIKVANISKRIKSSLVEFDGQGTYCFDYYCGESINSIIRKICKSLELVTTGNPIINYEYNDTSQLEITLQDGTKFTTTRLDLIFAPINHGHTASQITNFSEKVIQAVSYTHIQTIASSTWTVNHGLGYNPGGIIVLDSAGTQWLGTVVYINDNTLTIDFNGSSFGGKVYIS